MGIICLFFPAIIFSIIREKIKNDENKWDVKKALQFLGEYACGNILINWLIISARYLLKGNAGNIYESINNYSDFAIKYLFLAVFLAVAIPWIEKYVRERFTLQFDGKKILFTFSNRQKMLITIGFLIFFMLHNIIRMFDNSVWGDEGIVVGLVRKTWDEMLSGVAANGHSPFHYAFAWVLVKVFGESGFVFHLSASLPYFIILHLSVLIVRKWFGHKTAVILIVLSSLLDCAVVYNMEIRMYTWCELFIFLAFLALYKIYETQEIKYYVLMALFSLGGVYSHYFALASIGIMYGVLFVYSIIKERKRIVSVILSGGAVLGLLVPWLVFARKTKGVVISNYLIDEVSWYDCIEFVFHSKYSMQLLVVFFLSIVFWFLYEYKFVEVGAGKEGTTVIKIQKSERIKLSPEWIWGLSGIFAVFGTIIAAKLFSSFVYPIICLRYLYVAFIVAWLLMGIAISKLKLGRLWTIVLVLGVFISCYPTLTNSVKAELTNNKRLKTTLELTQPVIDENDFIYTDIVHFAWTVSEAYYPNVPHTLFGHPERWGPEDLPDLDTETQYWLFLSQPIHESIITNLEEQNKQAELVVDTGYIGTGNVWVYKIVDTEQGKKGE